MAEVGEKMVIRNRKVSFYSIIASLVVLVTICSSWFWLYARGIEIVHLPDPVDGISDASDIDLSVDVARISREMELYPYQLYTSEDFSSGDVDEPQDREDIFEAEKIPYGTFKTKIKLSPNTYYSIAGYSIDYGTRIYANGQEVANVGVVSSDPDIAVAGVNYMHFPVYTDENGELELILQYSNFVHNEGGSTPFIYISSPENINRFILDIGLPTYVLSGGLLILAVYFLLDGILRRKRLNLQLGLCCLLFSIRDQWFYIVSLIPYDYDWNVHYRVIVAVLVLTPLAILTMIDAAFPKALHKTVSLIYTALTILCIISICVVPTQEVTSVSDFIYILSIPYAILMIIAIIRHYIKSRTFTLKDVYLLTGIGILISTATVDLWFSDNLPAVTRGGIAPIGTLLFVITFMWAIATQAGEDELALEKSMRDKMILEQINTIKSDFLMKMAHEIKTPLTVMSGYAQLTNIQIKYDEVNEDTSQNLNVISTEATRLSELVASLLEMPTDSVTDNKLVPLSIDDYLRYCSTICKGVLEKNNNTLLIKGATGVHINGNVEMLIQMMLNLAVNSNRHMKNGEFTIDAVIKNDGETLSLIISDTGSGIADEYKEVIFDKNFTTGNSKGLGLSICKEIAHYHCADIKLLPSNSSSGAVFEVYDLKIANK